MRNRSSIYLGLFLMVFGLFAAQLKKGIKVSKAPSIMDATPAPTARPQARIQILYDRIAAEGVFRTNVSGIRLIPSHPPVSQDFSVELSGEEMFSRDGIAIESGWYSTLDLLGDIIKNEKGLRLEISGFADEQNQKEKKNTEYGASPHSFSYARAEWLAHYFERKSGVNLQEVFVLRGMGPVPHGKKVQLRFYYHSDEN